MRRDVRLVFYRDVTVEVADDARDPRGDAWQEAAYLADEIALPIDDLYLAPLCWLVAEPGDLPDEINDPADLVEL